MSDFWSGWVIVFTTVNIIACFWLIWWTQRPGVDDTASGESTGHYWDGNLTEYNNPLPRWWLWLFYITLLFSIGYLILYPGLGNFSGVLNWSQTREYNEAVEEADAHYQPLFARYAQTPVEQLAKQPDALDIGQRLFLNYCASCHGSDAKGAPGFPNLADNDWLYGDSSQAINHSIAKGRNGVMPAYGQILNEREVKEVAAYVRSLSGKPVNDLLYKEGKQKFTLCIGCHGVDGTGNQAIGAPNLTDNTWLYGGFITTIQASIRDGRNGRMPAHNSFLNEDKVHLLTAYIYSLRNQTPLPPEAAKN